MSSANGDTFISSFPIRCLSSFSCPIALAGTPAQCWTSLAVSPAGGGIQSLTAGATPAAGVLWTPFVLPGKLTHTLSCDLSQTALTPEPHGPSDGAAQPHPPLPAGPPPRNGLRIGPRGPLEALEDLLLLRVLTPLTGCLLELDMCHSPEGHSSCRLDPLIPGRDSGSRPLGRH